MKKLLLLLALVFTLGLATVATDAEASKRLGSGKSVGTQRQTTQDKAPAAGQASTATPAAAAATPSRSWMGPVAGLAAGLGLAALASHMGFGDELASMVMMGLLAAAIMVVIGFVMRKRAAAKQAGNPSVSPGGMQYAHVNPGAARDAGRTDQEAPAYKVSMPEGGRSVIGSRLGASTGVMAAGASQIPADFDVAGFERNAKVNFIRLQAANDAGNLDDIREFTTPEMFAELKLQTAERGTATQKSDVISIHAQVMEVAEELDRHIVSVRFTGVIREDIGAPDENFDEIWHLLKPRQGNSGWVLSGIQQLS
jgi:predicted lipid-binding transport protein (Tim44 family)